MKSFLSSVILLICVSYTYQGYSECGMNVNETFPTYAIHDVFTSTNVHYMVALSLADTKLKEADGIVGSINSSSFDCAEKGANTVVLRTTDEKTNSSMCKKTLTVLELFPMEFDSRTDFVSSSNEKSKSPNVIPLTCSAQDLMLRFPTSNENQFISIDHSDFDLEIMSDFAITSVTLSKSTFGCNDADTEVTITVVDASGAESTCTASVTMSSSCLNFNSEMPTSLVGNTGGGFINVLGGWSAQCSSVKYSSGGAGLSIDSAYLEIINEDCPLDSSYIINTLDFSGNLGAYNSPVELCYDIAIFDGLNPLNEALSTLVLFSGLDPVNTTYSAVFVPTNIQNNTDGFVKVCAPLELSSGGVLPSSAAGQWMMVNGVGVAAWDSLIKNVGGIGFSLDVIEGVDSLGVDNICIQNQNTINPSITCPQDMEMICNDVDNTAFGTVSIGENCMMEYVVDTASVEALDVCGVGIITRVFTVFDEIGNTSSCSQIITIVPPVEDFLVAPSDVSSFLFGDQCNDTIILAPAMINSFACGVLIDVVTTVNGVDLISNGGEVDLPAGTFEVLYTGTDECGNVSIVSSIVQLLRPCEMSAHSSLNISLNENCEGEITPLMLATFPIVCDNYYDVVLFDVYGDTIINDLLTDEHIGTTIVFHLIDPHCGNYVDGVLVIEDKFPPVLTCFMDTIDCGEIVDFPEPIISEFCGDVELIILDETIESVSCTDAELETTITRLYKAIDEFGNESEVCTQILSVRKFNLDSLKAPNLFSIDIECDASFPMDEFGNPDPYFYGGPLVNGVDIYTHQAEVCNVLTIYEDLDLDLPFESAIIRTFTVFYWSCDLDTTVQYVQLFKFVDTEGPDFDCPVDYTVAANASACSVDILLPTVVVVDACTSVDRIDVSFDGGFIEDGNGAAINLPMGENVVTYTAYDILGNSSLCSFIVTVMDLDNPVAICNQYTVVPLPQEGKVQVLANVFDDGSFDYCGIEKFEVRRMDAICDLNDELFGESITVCCDDLDSLVTVVMRVTDTSGNTNECMVFVEVQDKISPLLLADLPDITISCEYPIDPSYLLDYGKVVSDLDSRDSILINAEYVEYSGEPLDAFVLDNCITVVNDEINMADLNACGLGSALRTILIEDGQGNNLTITQNITRINVDTFSLEDLTWPAHYEGSNFCSTEDLDPEDLPIENGYPILSNIDCDQVGYTYDDSFFDLSGDQACFKIIRTWEVINWCQQINGEYVSFHFQQIIKILNTNVPEIVDTCQTLTQCSFDPNCGPAYIELTKTAIDDCTDSMYLDWSYSIDLFSDGTIDSSGNTNDASGVYPVGTHLILWKVSDQCGNEDDCMHTFEIQNCKLPTAYCLDNITADLTPMDLDEDGEIDTEMLFLKPYMVDGGSSQSCDFGISLSFSEDINDTIRTYDCDDIGLNEVQLWVTDVNGNQSYCITSIDVQDNNDVEFCADAEPIVITGQVYNQDDVMMKDVMVTMIDVDTILTDEDGAYSFVELEVNQNYKFTPTLADAALNGITTLDIVLIQKHILGLSTFTDPYKILAADVNQTSDVSGVDMIVIRKLLLGFYDEFPSSESWKFYMTDKPFIDESYPWANELHEYFEEYVDTNRIVDFMAVKMGDVNNSAAVNGLMESEIVTREEQTLIFSDEQLEAGEEKWISVNLGQAQKIHGFQLELQSNERVKILEVESNNGSMIVDYRINQEDGTVRILAYSGMSVDYEQGDPLFRMKVVSNATLSSVSEHISLLNSDQFKTELYTSDLTVNTIKLESLNAKEIEEIDVEFSLSQNYPNPWNDETMFEVVSPVKSKADFRVIDMMGKVVFNKTVDLNKGNNRITLDESALGVSGVLYYSVQVGGMVIMKKMLVLQ